MNCGHSECNRQSMEDMFRSIDPTNIRNYMNMHGGKFPDMEVLMNLIDPFQFRKHAEALAQLHFMMTAPLMASMFFGGGGMLMHSMLAPPDPRMFLMGSPWGTAMRMFGMI